MRKTRNITGTIVVRPSLVYFPLQRNGDCQLPYITPLRPDPLRYDWSHAALPSPQIDEFMQVRGPVVCPASICRSNWSIVMMRSFFESDDKSGWNVF